MKRMPCIVALASAVIALVIPVQAANAITTTDAGAQLVRIMSRDDKDIPALNRLLDGQSHYCSTWGRVFARLEADDITITDLLKIREWPNTAFVHANLNQLEKYKIPEGIGYRHASMACYYTGNRAFRGYIAAAISANHSSIKYENVLRKRFGLD